MTAEEFDKKVKAFDMENKYIRKQIYAFAESYLKHEVEAITDDNILKGANQQDSFKEKLAWGDGAKWFKTKLLKQ